MSRNGSGTYNLPAGNPVVTGTTISSTWANSTLSDMANALTGSIAADGQTPVTGNLNMGSNKITAMADPTVSSDASTKNYVDTTIATQISAQSIIDAATYLAKSSNLSDVANATTARNNLTAAKSGANSDITSLTGLTTALSVAQGGTGTTTSTGTGNVVLSASPTLTGTPIAPTAATNTSTTQIATTEFANPGASLSANGYQKLPSGLIMQWGYQTNIPADGGVDITYPIAFPNATGSVTATFTGSSSDSSPDFGIHTRNVSKTGFRISNADQYASHNAYWFAIGY